MAVIQAIQNTCMIPTRLLDHECAGCPWSFGCSLNKGINKKISAVKVSIKKAEGTDRQCTLCEQQKKTVIVKHRTDWPVCEDCLMKNTDFFHVVKPETWAQLRKKLIG